MSGRGLVWAIAALGGWIVMSFVSGCAKPVDAFRGAPPRYSTALMFEESGDYPQATDIGRSDWPSAAGRVQGGEIDVYSEYINDVQGGWQGGAGNGWGPFNWYNRRFTGVRVGSRYR